MTAPAVPAASSLVNLQRVRRTLEQRGLTPAHWAPEPTRARPEEPEIRPARLVEGDTLRAIPVGPATVCPHVVAFLDGTQRLELVGYAGTVPLFFAEVAAVVRERVDRRLRTAVWSKRSFFLGRRAALEAAGLEDDGYDVAPLPDDVSPHPLRQLEAARRAIDDARGALERAVGDRYRAGAGGWLFVDGSLSESPSWAADPRMIGVVKSHASLPFDGEMLVEYLRLPPGHRTPVFRPVTRQVAPVYSWALRLWPWQGKDLLHGLIRVEAAEGPATLALADEASRWLLAERVPLSTPDARWDRLLYGVHDAEMFLRVRHQ